VLRFSVGFGRILWSRRIGPDRTEWALSAVPLGGYVKMVDEREGAVAPADLPRAFNRQSVWKRMAIVAAGPLANLLLAVLLFAGTYVAGMPGQRALLAAPPPSSAAASAGLRGGDLVVDVDGEPVASWQELRWRLIKAQGQQAAVIAVERPEARGERSSHTLALTAVKPADWEGGALAILGLKADFGAPTMADFAGQSAQQGILVFVGYLALISISLGVLNLLPVPLLDGGHLLYYFAEIIKGSPVSDRAFEVGQRIGMAVLAMLMALALFNDVSRLF